MNQETGTTVLAAPHSRLEGQHDSISWPRKRRLFGLGINTADYAEVLEKLFEAADKRVPAIVEHLAVNNLMLAVRDAGFLKILDRFNVVTMDGQGVRFAMHALTGARSKDRVTARELMLAVCQKAEMTGHGIYLYGDEPGTLNRLQARLLERFPYLRILGAEPSAFRPLSKFEDAALVARVNNSGATFLFVALGCPLQERFVFEHKDRMRAIQLCVGSAFKFLSGDRRIAPRWMQRIGMEWLHRLAQDPGRLGMRYLTTNSAFVWLSALALFDQLICGSKIARRLKWNDEWTSDT
jgi:N-acetylglucosaminyldiphosphoundecaprenol N-acetyl-beta-D-mannosaminyltransferase